MNEQELADIKGRVEAANEGPWTNLDVLSIMDDHDLTFCAHARIDVPALLAEVERLNGERQELAGLLAKFAASTIRLTAENARLNNHIENLAFTIEDETGMLSNAPLTAEKLEEILHTLKGQRDYAAETAEMHAKLIEQCRNEYNLFRYDAGAEIERLTAENARLRAKLENALRFSAQRANHYWIHSAAASDFEKLAKMISEALKGGGEG